MSLFDILKYPISSPPTSQEIDNLPDELQEEFTNVVDSHIGCVNTFSRRIQSSEYLATIMGRSWHRHTIPLIVRDIRKRIEEL